MYLDGKPYVVAELNSSHRGKVDIAKKMIDAAKQCGCNAVKFQSWTPESLYCRNYYEKNPIAKRMVSGMSLSSDKLKELADYCKITGIDFSSTPYSNEEVDFMVQECNPAFIKVASMDINNLPFLRYIAHKQLPIVLSTGMADMDEIEQAVRTIEKESACEICLLHCVSLYPAAPEIINLNNIITLKEKFPECRVGYSDHTIGCGVACASVGLGAVLIEKHFTLDNSIIGWDNQMATEPEEMRVLVCGCRDVYASMGSYERVINEDELEQRKKMRRSIVAARNLESGHVLTDLDLTAKRPEGGVCVSRCNELIGKRIKRDISVDEMILEGDIDWEK